MSVTTGRWVILRSVSGVMNLGGRLGHDHFHPGAGLRQLAGDIRRLVSGDASGYAQNYRLIVQHSCLLDWLVPVHIMDDFYPD